MNSYYRRKDREWVLGDRLCSCHFTDGRRDQLPTIVIVSPAQQLVLLHISESVLLVCYDLTYLTGWYFVECPQHSTTYLAQSTRLSVHQRLNSMRSNLSETRLQTKFCLIFFMYLFYVISDVVWHNNLLLLATIGRHFCVVPSHE